MPERSGPRHPTVGVPQHDVAAGRALRHPGAPRSADATRTPASITESLAVLPVASFAGPSVLLGLVDGDDDGRGGLFSALPL
jgi:hypothetical protein